ncbi:MAG TPA: ABC transporter permease [Candidatus Methanoculleus thermohydrogenotrophicum]|jgi:ABC-2 type transport system permease protein|nr:ABC transporter permease [Candidatus Methanoculleus thermohydrogenotrophicum]HOB17613.1 ABC transporter permease [Candidatus Methanoculleus thermohydrogenotrophicum]HPZ38290.1 ABC transporter permease [Candidatus Methanoculleus thermohydrogenotrophicum]
MARVKNSGTSRLIDPLPIYIMWLREMKRMFRVKARLVSNLLMPILFLAFLGIPLSLVSANGSEMFGLPPGVDFLDFLAPGIVGMTILFSSLMGGASVVWDKEFGFLKEVMVAPVSRFSILLGRQAGAMTISIGQALIILLLAALMGVNFQNSPIVLLSIVFMVLTGATFMGLGLILATKLGEMEGFMSILTLFQMPLFFMSVALFPLELMPGWFRYIICLNPFTYGVDGLRGTLIGVSNFPLLLDFVVIFAWAAVLAGLGTHFFSTMEAD